MVFTWNALQTSDILSLLVIFASTEKTLSEGKIADNSFFIEYKENSFESRRTIFFLTPQKHQSQLFRQNY